MPVDSGRYTPETLSRRRKLAEALMSNSMQPRPIGSHLEGLSQLANTAVGALAMRQADREEDEYRKRIDSTTQKMARALMGGRDPRNAEYTDPLMVQTTAEMFPDRDEAMRLAMSPEGAEALRQNPLLAQMVIGQLKPPELERVDLGDRIGFMNASGEIVREVPKGATPDAVLRERGAMFRHQEPSGSALLGSETTRRGQDIMSQTARRGQDLNAQIEREKIAAQQERDRAARQQRAQSQLSTIDRTISAVDDALGLVGWSTAGIAGAAQRQYLPGGGAGTDARSLAAVIDTIKANLSFQELARMRAESPTGGALGSITERELDLLGATIANLDPNQSAPQLRSQLEKVREHLENIKKLNMAAAGMQQPQAPPSGEWRDIEALMQRYLP